MGTPGALIMGFFGAVFAVLTLAWQWHVGGAALALPFLAPVAIALAAGRIGRHGGVGVRPSARARRAIAWSSAGEGVGIFIAANIVMNLHRPDLLLPAMALVVGLHFLPIARAARFRPFYALAAVLVCAAAVGCVVAAPAGGAIAGLGAAAALWAAAAAALVRDLRARRAPAIA